MSLQVRFYTRDNIFPVFWFQPFSVIPLSNFCCKLKVVHLGFLIPAITRSIEKNPRGISVFGSSLINQFFERSVIFSPPSVFVQYEVVK